MRKLLFGFISVLFFIQANGQEVRGLIVDQESNEPLPFVNISIKNTGRGTTSDVNGRFRLDFSGVDPTSEVSFSFIGYNTLTIPVTNLFDNISLSLTPSTTQLNEVVVIAGENPANRIIKQAIQNRKQHDPQMLDSYSFKSYNKTIFTLENIENPTKANDSLLAGGHLFITEAFSEVRRVKPNLIEERVIGNQFSGWDNPKLAILSSTFQPFGFYDNYLNLFDINYINPVSKNSLKVYDFYLQDSLLQLPDTTYIISFEPSGNNPHEKLKGLLYINTDGFAIENIIVFPADTLSKLYFEVQQKYEKIQGRWFPKQLYTQYTMKGNTIEGIPLLVKNKSELSDIKLNSEINKKDISINSITYDQKSGLFDDWAQVRTDTLSARELKTYANFDSLEAKDKRLLNTVFDASVGLAGGGLQIGAIEILPRYLIRLNRYEKFGLGIGLATSDKISRVFRLQGYGAYGFGDRALKYGGKFQINVNKQRDHHVGISFKQDIEEPGSTNFYNFETLNLATVQNSYRRFLMTRADSVQRLSFNYQTRISRSFEANIFYNTEKRNPAYTYNFRQGDNPPSSEFKITEIGIDLRMLLNARLMEVGNFRVINDYNNPYLNLRISRGMSLFNESDFQFVRGDLHLRHELHLKRIGKTTIDIFAGKIWGDELPYSYLTIARALNADDDYGLYIPGYLQVAGIYEFLSDEYFQTTLSHDFGPLFTAAKGALKPSLIIVQNISYGSLRNPQAHQNIEFKTMEEGYFESGVLLENLLRIDADLYYVGFGIGTFYRYGSYAYDTTRENFSFVLSTRISF